MTEQQRFVSWVRFGAGAARAAASPVEVTARIAGEPVTQSIRLLGPGDVVGLARGIVRRGPPQNALGVTPAMFPLVELQPADLPWRYSPVMPAATELVPWIALVVVPAATPFTQVHGAACPVLDVAGDQLPPWADLALWCHAQLTAPFDGRPLAQQIADRPHAALARLLCPRRLERNQRYRAAIVPTFEAGRRATLGEEFTPEMVTAPAWSGGATTVRLPTYDSWEFGTGEAADFEVLARKLRGLPPSALTPLSIGLERLGVATRVNFFGVLKPPGLVDSAPASEVADAIAGRLATTDDAVGPPVYGSGPVGRLAVSANDTSWFAELNLDPRWRVMAGVGAEVVRLRQEELVASAWDRTGEIRRANRLVAATQLGSAARRRLVSRTVATRSPDALIVFASPALVGEPIAHALRFERLAPAVRRAARLRASWLRDRTAGTVSLARRATAAVVPRARPKPAGMVTFSIVRQRTTPPSRRAVRTRAADVGRFSSRVTALREILANRLAIPALTFSTLPALPASPLATAIVDQIHAKLDRPLSWQRVFKGDARALEAVADLVAAPDLSRPLADDVAAVAPRLFSAGLAEIPMDRTVVLEVDVRAIEAVIAGANHELARELVWREFPLDLRATLLSTFWDRRGTAGPLHDVPPMQTWTQPLGENAFVAPTTVVVIRGELIRRFPDAIIGHVPAIADPEARRRPADELVLPRFRGRLGEDTVYVGLPADLATLRAGLGSYVVIMERPGAARFGLDAVASATPPTRWDELAWDHAPPGLYLTRTPPVHLPVTPGGATWAQSSAQIASITERTAVRLSIHLDEMLREDSDGRS